MRRVLVATAVAVAVLAGAVHATRNEATSPAEPKGVCEESLRSIVVGDIQGGFSVLGKHVLRQPVDEEWELLARGVAKQISVASPMLGKPLGYELVRESKVNNSLRKYIYLVKYERDVQRWVFVFYRPDGAWKLHRVNWDQNVDAMLD